MRTTLVILTAFLPLVFATPTRAATTNEFEPLVALARTRMDDYTQKRTKFLERVGNRLDVDAAATTGWEAWLMARILNAHYEHPEDARRLEKPGPPTIRGTYTYGGTSTLPQQILSIEMLWKGAHLGGLDRKQAGGKEFAPLPLYAQLQLLDQFWRAPEIEGSTSLWLQVARSDAPGGLKGLAYWVIAGRDVSLFREFAFKVLENTNSQIAEKYMVMEALFARRPSFTWDVLNSTSHLWLRDAQGISDPGLVAMSTVTNAELKAFMFEVLRNKELAPATHNTALKILIEGGQNWEAVEDVLRNKDSPKGLRATAIEYAPRQPVEKIRRFLDQYGIGNLDETSRSVLIGALKEKGGKDDMNFLRKLSEEASLPSDIRETTAQAADEMSKRIK